MPQPGVVVGRSGADVLGWSRALVEPALIAAVQRLPGPVRRVAGYHFGWSDEHGEPLAAPVRHGLGKAFRSALTLLAARGTGGGLDEALPGACAVELVHNFSLLHDDVMDRDLIRRHRPASWVVFGVGPAILAGDALLTAAFDLLAGTAAPGAVLPVLSTALYELVDGQSADLSFEQHADVEPADCVRMAGGKTGSLLGAACRLGGVLGGGTAEQARALHGFGHHVGLAYQFVDDLLGIWGDPGRTGKPVHSDLANRKKSLPVVAALTSGTRAGAELADVYERPDELTDAELARAASLVDAAGGRAWATEQAAGQLARGLSLLDGAGLSDPARGELAALAELAVHRDR